MTHQRIGEVLRRLVSAGHRHPEEPHNDDHGEQLPEEQRDNERDECVPVVVLTVSLVLDCKRREEGKGSC